jgi:hypothetical protein
VAIPNFAAIKDQTTARIFKALGDLEKNPEIDWVQAEKDSARIL